MNRLILSQGSTFSVGAGSSLTNVFGTAAGAETISIALGAKVVLDASFNRGGDVIRLSGNAASYTAVRSGSSIILTDAEGTSVTIPVGTTGAQVSFADSAPRTLVYDTNLLAIKLGADTIDATADALSAGTALPPAPTQTVTLTKSADTVDEGATTVLTLQTTGIPAGSQYAFALSGVSAADVVGGALTGLVTIGFDGVGLIPVELVADGRTEVAETLTVTVAGVSQSIAVNDTSAAPAEQTSFTVSAADIAAALASNSPVTVDVGNTGARTVTIQSDGATPTQGVIINGNADTAVTAGASGDRITLSGNGNNTVSSGAGNDTVTVFGSGNNTVNVGTGDDNVTTGSGDDTIVFASGALGEGDFVTAGGGNDTVVISGDGNVVAANAAGTGAVLTGVENIVLNGTTLTIDAVALQTLLANGLTSITGSSVTSELVITALNTATGAALDLTGLTFNGGLKSISTTGAGTLTLNTTQDDLVGTVSGTGLTQQVIVPGVQSVAQAQALIAGGVTAKFALADTAANLALAPASVFASASSVEATTDATAAQAVQIAAVIVGSSNASIVTGSTPVDAAVRVNVTDTASMLANNVSGLAIADRVTATSTATVEEADAIAGANTGGTLFTASYAVVDTAGAFAAASAGTLNGATSVTVVGPATIAQIVAVNTALAAAGGPTLVEAGYTLNDTRIDLTDSTNSTIVSAAGGVNVVTSAGGTTLAAIGVAQAVAIEALANTGANAYKLSDTPTLLLGAGEDVTAVATKTGGGVVTDGVQADRLSVSQLNQLVDKFGSTLFDTARGVEGTAAEIVQLSTAARTELTTAGDISVLSTSTATVAELTALNTFLTVSGSRITAAPVENTVKVADTAANLLAAVGTTGTSTTLTALNNAASVAVTGEATVKQVTDINTRLNSSDASGGLTAVASGYTLVDSAANLAAAAAVVDASAKVTVTGTATVDQIDLIADAFYTATASIPAGELGVKVVYTLRDTAANLTTAISLSDGTSAVLADYQAGATSVSITDTVISPATAISLRALTKFDRSYAIEGNVSQVGATETGGTVGTAAALTGATSVTLVDSFANLFTSGVPVAAQGRATTVIASGTLIDMTAANAADKANVDGFRITDGTTSAVVTVALTDVTAVNALSAIAPTQYNIASSAYSDLMGTGTGVATLVANAAGVTVSDTLSVSKYNLLDARAGGTITYGALTDSASALASSGAAAAIAAKGSATITVDTTGTLENATVAEAAILVARGITGFTISDTAANISAASATLLANAAVQFILVNDGGELTLSVASAAKVFDRADATTTRTAGTLSTNQDGSAAATYNLIDSAANLAGADVELIGFAQNVTANTAADVSQAGTLATRTSMGTISYSVSDLAANFTAGAGLNRATNITATDAVSLAQARIINDATNSGTNSYRISDAAGTLALANNTTNAANIATIEAATGTVTATGNATGAQASLLAAYAKAVVFSVSDTPTALAASTGLGEAVNIVSTGATATTAQAATIMAAANTGTTTISAVSGTAAQALTLTLGANDTITALTVTGTAAIADAVAINAKDTGANIVAVSFATVSGSAADILANLTTANLATTVSVTGAVSVAQAALLQAADAADVDTVYTFSISDTYANLMENSDATVSAVDASAALTGATRITVTDAMTIAQAVKLATSNTLAVEADVFTIVDADANILAAMAGNPATSTTTAALLAKAASVTLANGTVVRFDDIGGTLHIVGTRAQIEALPASLVTANKIMEVSVADLAANPAYFTSLPGVVDYRVVDTFANLTSGNALIGAADGITVTDNITMAQAVTARALGLAVGEVSYNLEDTAALLTAGSTTSVSSGVVTVSTVSTDLDAATNVATTSATVEQAAILRTAVGSTGTATYSISVADTDDTLVTGNAAVFNGARDITVTGTTGGSITATEAGVLLAATNSGSTTIARVSGAAADIAALASAKGANETITAIEATGTSSVANIRTLQGMSNSVTYALSDTAANLAAAGDAVLNGATTIALSTGAATLAQLAIIDAATPSNANTTVAVADTAANILAASPTLLARANGAITVSDTSLTADVATQLSALDAANDTFSINVAGKTISDSSANLILAANAAAVDAATAVVVTDTVTAARAALVLTAAAVTSGTTVEVNVSDVYSAVVLNSAVANGAKNITITNVLSASQARTADLFTNTGTVTFDVRDSATNLVNSLFTSGLALATTVTVSTTGVPPTVAQAGVLSDMVNVVGYTITDTPTAVFNALNTINGAGAADRETLVGATSITLNGLATVEQVVGVAGTAGNGEKLGLGSLNVEFNISDTGAAIAAALRIPAQAAQLVSGNGTVALSGTTGVSVADLTLIDSVFGSSFVNHIVGADNLYYITDGFANILAADQVFVEGAFTLVANGTSGTASTADVIDFTGFTKGMTINGLDGNDTITGGAGGDTIDGGTGVDTYIAQGGTAISVTLNTATAATVTVTGGTDDSIVNVENVVGTSGADTINGDSANNTITGGAGIDTITGGAGIDTLSGGAGDDTFVYALAADLVASNAVVDSITGGDGTDTIRIDQATAFTIASTDIFTRAVTVETLSASAANAGNISITLDTTAFAAGIRTVSLAGDTNATGANVVNLSANADADIDLTVVGSAGADTITGGDGDDTITGGAGADTITGGDGADTFVFTAGSSGGAPSATVFDTITDFATESDIIDYSVAMTIGANAGTAAAGVASIDADGLATFHVDDDTLAEQIIAVEAGINAGGTAAAGQTAIFNSGSDSYVFISDGVNGIGANDVLIKLTGVDVTVAAFNEIVIAGGNFTLG